jgi:small subunit ribosomal protein S1
VLKVNPDTRKISLGMKQLQPDPWSAAAAKYDPGDRVRGTVARITDFGAFINLEPGVDGLIHVSEMSWSKKQRHPRDIVSVGDAVEVVILVVNPAEKRISLGLKQALGDPWEEAKQKYPAGAVVEGPIVSITNFGAFVDLGNGIEGMVHVGDITNERRLEHPKEFLKQGQTVRAQVLEVDREKRRIRLGMKQLEPTSVDNYIAEHQPGEQVTGRVVEVKNDRAKVELGEGVFATCKLGGEPGQEPKSAGVERADIGALTAMLAEKWKQGGATESQKAKVKAGEIRTFRIATLDPAQKRIQLELAG